MRASLPVLLACGVIFLLGCQPKANAPGIDAKISIEFKPNPPTATTTTIDVTLTDPAGQPLRLGEIEVEGNMNHAGMVPVFTRLRETEPGRYSGTIEFTMGGDWFLLLTSQPSSHGRLNKKVDVWGVRPK